MNNQLIVKKTKFLDKIGLLELSCAAIGTAVIELAVTDALTKAFVSITVASIVAYGIIGIQTNWLQDKKINQFIQKQGVLPLIGLTIVTLICLYFAINPSNADAQFFTDAEKAIVTGINGATAGATNTTNGLNGNSGEKMVKLIFFTLRFILIVYLGINIVKIVGQMRDDEDWKSTAKFPCMIIILLTVADFTSGMIIAPAG